MHKGRMYRGGRMISAPTVLNEVSIEFVGAHYVRPYEKAVRWVSTVAEQADAVQ